MTTTNSSAALLSLPQQSAPSMHLLSGIVPPATQHVIALVSGGKDSFLALLHCLAQNHHVVALANLHPPTHSPSPVLSPSADPTTDPTSDAAPDANSHMYQTVGHTLIPLYAHALSVPLYRGEILGTAINSRRDYHPNASSSPLPTSDPVRSQQEQARPADETESLIPLLRRIQHAHPSATALASGAILSTYQRTRIESVALRLGLVPLAPLWQYPFLPTPVPRSGGLLEDVAAVGLEARIVKVASGGLDEGFLWGDLGDAAVRRRVEIGVGRFGGSVLGEGGEFETVVVNGPDGVFKRRIELEEAQRVVRRGEGGEAYLDFTGGRVVEKKEKKELVAEDSISGEEWRRKLRVPGLWDERFEALVGKTKKPLLPPKSSSSDVDDPNTGSVDIPTEQPPRGSPLPDKQCIIIPQPHITHTRSTLTISNLTSSSSFPSPSFTSPSSLPPLSQPLPSSSAVRQTHSILSHLRNFLAAYQPPLSASDVLFTTLLLRHMSHFSVVNAAYAEFLAEEEGGEKPIPPARVTIGCGDRLPRGLEVVMRVVVARGVEGGSERGKDGLHVQSRSYWAPANIGPYSQAVAMPFSPSSPLPGHPAGGEKEEEEDERGKAAPAVVYLAGQIPLIPATMEMITEAEELDSGRQKGGNREEKHRGNGEAAGFGTQTCLALQHLWRVSAAMKVQWWMGAVAFLAHAPSGTRDEEEREMDNRARVAWVAWKTMHDPAFFSNQEAEEGEDDDGVDVWDRTHGRLGAAWAVVPDEPHRLPDFGVARAGGGGTPGREPRGPADEDKDEGLWCPGFFAAHVAELPRGCGVEWQALGVRNVDGVQIGSPQRGENDTPATVRICTATRLGSVSYISIPRGADVAAVVARALGPAGLSAREHDTLDVLVYADESFHLPSAGEGKGGDAGGRNGEVLTAVEKAQVIPCRAVWGPGGTRLQAGIVAQVGM